MVIELTKEVILLIALSVGANKLNQYPIINNKLLITNVNQYYKPCNNNQHSTNTINTYTYL